jgi:hypothetical protein
MQLILVLFLGLSYDPFPDSVRDLFLLFRNSSGHPVSNPLHITALLPGLKLSECESTTHSFRVGIMNGWIYTFAQPYCTMLGYLVSLLHVHITCHF